MCIKQKLRWKLLQQNQLTQINEVNVKSLAIGYTSKRSLLSEFQAQVFHRGADFCATDTEES